MDAGAQGFVDLLNGIFSFVRDGDLNGFKMNLEKKKTTLDLISPQGNFENSEFRYCTECLINGENIEHKKNT